MRTKRYGAQPWSAITLGFLIAGVHLNVSIFLVMLCVPLYGVDGSAWWMRIGQGLLLELWFPMVLAGPLILLQVPLVGVLGGWLIARRRRASRARASLGGVS